MHNRSWFLKGFGHGLLAVGLLGMLGSGFAQSTVQITPDAQIEANVLKALAGAPVLADQAITSTTIYGTVTLSGTVRDEKSRKIAEKLVSNADGVRKVVDELTIGAGVDAANDSPGSSDSQLSAAEEGTNPNLQSDGTIAPKETRQDGSSPAQQNEQQAVPYPAEHSGSQQSDTHPSLDRPDPSLDRPDRRPYGRPDRQPPPAFGRQPYVEQRGGDAVVVETGAVLRVRVDQAMNSRQTAPGTLFDGVVLSDVVAGGFVAIPRGAAVQGSVVNAYGPGQLKGHGGIALQLTQVTVGGRTYPLSSDVWSHQGADKTGNTVGTTVGLGAVGALIGAAAGGGVGAAVGAGMGGVAGLGVSSVSRAGEAGLPSEAIVYFHLTHPLELTTVSQAELNRLGGGLPGGSRPQRMQRRYYPPPPPPPPFYYRPGYFGYSW